MARNFTEKKSLISCDYQSECYEYSKEIKLDGSKLRLFLSIK